MIRNFCHKIFQLNDSILSSLSSFELVDKNNSEMLTLQTETNFTIFQLIIVRFLIRAVIKSWALGISLATTNVAPGHFHRKIEEK